MNSLNAGYRGRLYVYLAVLLSIGYVASAALSSLDTAVNPGNGHSYFLLENSNWSEAEAAARLLGGHLVTINDEAENEWVWNRWGQDKSLWIGLNDASVEGTFRWVSGETAAYRNWRIREPNGGNGGEDYAYFLAAGLSEGNAQWNDLNDTRELVGQPLLHGVVEISQPSDERLVYDLSEDFSKTSNPNGPWSYGSLSNFGAMFRPLLFEHAFASDNGVPLFCWQLSGSEPPTVCRVMGPGTAVSAGGQFTGPTGTVWFSPGNDGQAENFGVIRFTVPTGGVYRIELGVSPVFEGVSASDTDIHVLRNGQELFGEFLAARVGTRYTNELSFAAGDRIDFAIGRGQDGLALGSSLKIRAQLSTVTTNAPPAGCVPLPAGAVAWWPLEGDASDVLGTNEGVVSGEPVFASGEVGLGMKFDGTNDQVRVPASSALDLGAAAGMTIEFWINPSSLSGNRPVVEWNSGPGTYSPGMHLWHSYELPGRLLVNMPGAPGSASAFIESGGGILTTGQWQHVAFTYNRATGVGKLYRDGAEVTSKAMGTVRAQTTYDLYLGARAGGPLAHLAGELDEVTFYTRALSGEEIAAISDADDAGKCLAPEPPPCVPQGEGMVAWWPFNGNPEDIVGTNSGNLVGSPSFTAGKVGEALNFDGLDDRFGANKSTALDIGAGEGFTIEMWVNPASVTNAQPLVEWNNGHGVWGVFLWISPPGRLHLNLREKVGADHEFFTSNAVLVAEQFQHVAVTFDRATRVVQLFRNGEKVFHASTGSLNLNLQTSHAFYVGTRHSGANSNLRFHGKVDELSLYRRALSGDEIAAISSAGDAGKCFLPPPPQPPLIISQPTSQSVTQGATASFEITATGAMPLRYQWQRDGEDLGGATNRLLILNNVLTTQAGGYSAIVANDFGMVTSMVAQLTVAPLPGSVALATLDRAVNPGNGHTYFLLENSNWSEAEAAARLLGGHLVTINDEAENGWVWNRWGQDKSLWIGLNDASVEGTFRWVSGETAAYRNWRGGEPNDGNGGEDYAYFLAAGFSEGNAQWNDLNDTRELAGQPLLHGVVEISQPSVARLVYDLSEDFSTTSNPNGPWSYGSLSNFNATFRQLSFGKSFFSDNGVPLFSWQVSDTEAPAVCRVMGPGTAVSASGQFTGAPGTVWFGPGNEGQPEHFGAVRFIVPTGGVYRIELVLSPAFEGVSAGDTEIHVLRNGQELFGEFLAARTGTGYTNELGLAVGDWIDFAIGRGQDGVALGSVLKIQTRISTVTTNVPPPQPPLIISQPTSQSVTQGATASFEITATGAIPLRYQWQRDGEELGGATNRLLILNNVLTTQAGGYSAVVANDFGMVTSMVAQLTVSPLPGSVPLSILDTAVNPGNGHSYFLLENSNWSEAEAAARLLGGHLVTINDEAENEWVWNRWGQDKSLWIGLNDASVEGTFRWVSGETAAYRNWRIREPNGGNGGEDYAYFLAAGFSEGNAQWNDLNDTRELVGQPLLHGVVEISQPSDERLVYDLSEDFSTTSNPNGPWSYGSLSNFNALLRPLLFEHSFISDNGVRLFSWQLSGSEPPTVCRVMGPGTAVSAGGQFNGPTGTVWFSPGNDGQAENFGVIRFTVPTGGVYRVELGVSPVFEGASASDTDIHVLRNGQELFGEFLAARVGTGYTNELSVAAGDRIDFAIGRGQDGLALGSSLKIRAQISTVTTNVLPPQLPLIISEPTSQSVTQGATASFEITATGAMPLRYQWQLDGLNLAGSTNSLLTVETATAADAGSYRVIVSNPYGSATSAVVTLLVAVDLAEALDATNLVWNTSGAAPWSGRTGLTPRHRGAAQSGDIGDNQQSVLGTIVTGPILLSFSWRVSSEFHWDRLTLFVGGVERANISGEIEWRQVRVLVPAGAQTVEWIYSKDGSDSVGEDAAWVDQVRLESGFLTTFPPLDPQLSPFKFSLLGLPGSNYVLETTTDLSVWTPVLTNTMPPSGLLNFSVAPDLGSPRRFFRAVLP